MRKWLLPLVTAAVFLALLYFVVGVDRTEQGPAEEKPKLLSLAADAVEEVDLAGPEMKLRLVRRTEDGFEWWLEPQHVPASDTKLDYVLGNLTELRGEPLPVVGRPDEDFGLDRPTWRVELRAGGKAEALLIGQQVPVTQTEGESSYYVRVEGRPEVYTVAGWVVDQLAGGVEEWRDRYPVDLPTPEVAAVEVAWDGERLAAKREGERWLLSAPRSGEADATKVRTLINRLGFLEAREFVDDNPTPQELSSWGLSRPWLKAVLATAGEKPLRRELLVGGQNKDRTMYYARLADRPWVFLVEVRGVEDLEAAARELMK